MYEKRDLDIKNNISTLYVVPIHESVLDMST